MRNGSSPYALRIISRGTFLAGSKDSRSSAGKGSLLERGREMVVRARLRRFRRGFSMTETMVAVVLLALATLVFGASLPATSQTLQRGRNSDLACDACQQQLE